LIGGVLSANMSRADSMYQSIEIRGSEAFVRQTKDALKLLEAKAPSAYFTIEKCVGRIESAARSAMMARATPPTYAVGDPTAFYSITWYAGTIAHDAIHCKQYWDYRKARGASVPADIWTGQAAELEAIRYQLWVMSAIGAPAHEMRHIRAQDGKHYDLNGDGKYSEEDVKLRKW
jgi:hypothetical protein